MEALTDAMIAVQKQAAQGIMKGSTANFKLIIRQVLADGDLVAVHSQRQVHLFRFSGDKIVEYWDITQNVPENVPN
jgi:predicted SnoaL-like aldol condensation-catalyzing enzyme